MPTTPVYGLPWPLGSDTPDVPRDVQALAEATEAAIDDVETSSGMKGRLQQRGNNSGAATPGGYIRITFPIPYPSPPIVVATPGDSSGLSGPFYVVATATYADVYGFTPTAAGRVLWVADGVAP